MPCYINIEDRYRYSAVVGRNQHNVWAATAVAVVGAGAAVAGGVMQSQAAGRAAKAQQKASDRLAKQLSKIEPPRYDIARDISEAGQVTDFNLRQLEQIFPGATNQRQVAARATDALLRGEIPKDVQQQIMRSVAELGGAGYVPPTAGQAPVGGFQVPQAMLSRQLGLTSLELQNMGQGLAQSWQKLSGAFIESPVQLGQARLQFEKAAADVQSGVAGAQYEAQSQAVGSRFAADASFGQTLGQVGGGLMSFGTGMASGGALSGMGGGGMAPNKAGFYGSPGAGAMAYNVAPSALSYQAPSGGFLGIGGRQGGYYYNPSGVYGR